MKFNIYRIKQSRRSVHGKFLIETEKASRTSDTIDLDNPVQGESFSGDFTIRKKTYYAQEEIILLVKPVCGSCGSEHIFPVFGNYYMCPLCGKTIRWIDLRK